MRELKNGMPQLDPCCFPLLHPRGTLGWRWFMKKEGSGTKKTEKEVLRMQQILDDAKENEITRDDEQNVAAEEKIDGESDAEEEEASEENLLDEDNVRILHS